MIILLYFQQGAKIGKIFRLQACRVQEFITIIPSSISLSSMRPKDRDVVTLAQWRCSHTIWASLPPPKGIFPTPAKAHFLCLYALHFSPLPEKYFSLVWEKYFPDIRKNASTHPPPFSLKTGKNPIFQKTSVWKSYNFALKNTIFVFFRFFLHVSIILWGKVAGNRSHKLWLAQLDER